MAKQCPFCSEEVQDEAKICKHCQSNLIKACPFCGEEVNVQAIKCKHCGSALDAAAGPATAPPGPSKSGIVTAVGIVTIIIGVLMMCGSFGLLFVGGAATLVGTAADKIEKQAERDPALAERHHKEARELREAAQQAKSIGGIGILLGVLYLIASLGGIIGGIGVILRKKWGQIMAIGVAGLVGLCSVLGLAVSGPSGIFGLLIGGGYTAFALVVLLNKKFAAEFV